jgi:hypothetical protein
LLGAGAMKTLPRPAFAVALLGLVACGGSVEGSPSATSTPSPVDDPDDTQAPADRTPSAVPPTQTSQGPSGPETGPANDLHSIAKGADAIVIRFGVLGEARPNPADECGPSAYEYRIDRTTWEATAKLCSSNTSDGHAAMIVTNTRTLTTLERTYVEEELMKLEVGTMPTLCLYDGPAYEIELIGPAAKSTRYWDEDYNCQHLTSVEYVIGSIGALRSRVHEILLPGG